jgi:hypothetical protein
VLKAEDSAMKIAEEMRELKPFVVELAGQI